MDLKFQKYFIQPAYGIKYKNVEIAASLRATYLNYYSVNSHISPGYTADAQSGKIDQYRNYYLCEPGILARAGWDMIKFQMQYSYSNTFAGKYLHVDRHFFGCGMSFYIPACRSKKNVKKDTQPQ